MNHLDQQIKILYLMRTLTCVSHLKLSQDLLLNLEY